MATVNFSIVSMIDLAATLMVVRSKLMYESNPIAGYFLANFGEIGLVAFKLAVVLFAIGVMQYIKRHNKQTAKKLCHAATYITLGVVVYTLSVFSVLWLN